MRRVVRRLVSLTFDLMNRFTLFALFLSSIIVVIVAEIMVNEYLRTPYGIEGAANVFQGQQTTQQVAQTPPPAVNQASAGSLSTSLLQKAGIINEELQNVAFGGKLFGRIALTDLNFIRSFESYIGKNNVARVAAFYEFNPGSEQSAKEFYDLLKQRCQAEIGVILNETDGFGEGSFYVNYFEFPEKVFLLFRKGTRVFAFSYNKELHGSITKLIGLL